MSDIGHFVFIRCSNNQPIRITARLLLRVGQKEKSKELYDKYIHSNDVMYIWNSIGFYRRNRYDEELKQIYTEILN